MREDTEQNKEYTTVFEQEIQKYPHPQTGCSIYRDFK
jgi:hypothetical protein